MSLVNITTNNPSVSPSNQNPAASPKYWKSLRLLKMDQLADSSKFREWISSEFPSEARPCWTANRAAPS